MRAGSDYHDGFVTVTLCQAGPWRPCSVYGFMRHGSRFSWAAGRGKVTVRFWGSVWPPELLPQPFPPPACPCLTSTASRATAVLLQSSALRKLFSLASHPPYITGSQNMELALKKYLMSTPLQGPLNGGSRQKWGHRTARMGGALGQLCRWSLQLGYEVSTWNTQLVCNRVVGMGCEELKGHACYC